ncbi:MAG: glycosyltransferase [Acidimicrobiales bacterium]
MNVVALIPAYNSVDRIAATVTSTAAIPGVTRVLVIDDGSVDGTASVARGAGAEVLSLGSNRGKGGAVAAGVDASPDADVFLLVDADLAETAAETARLLPPVLDGDADLAVAVLPGAAGRGGFGLVRDVAGRGIRRGCGWRSAAPLSGQRAVRAELLRGLGSAERFGLEVAMSIDAVRSGARVVEVEAPIEHRHTGRTVQGFAHRARQGADVLRALWPRLTPGWSRLALPPLVALLALGAMLVGAGAAEPAAQPPDERPERVVVIGVPGLGLDDLDRGRVPRIDRIWQERGALGATSVRTASGRPTSYEAWASIGAGTRVRAGPGAALALEADTEYEGSTAARVTARRTGAEPSGEVAVVTAAAVGRQAGADLSSSPGALGDALSDAGASAGVVDASDMVGADGEPILQRPSAVAVMGSNGFVDHGRLGGGLLREDEAAPYGLRSDAGAHAAAVLDLLDGSDLVVAAAGDMDRYAAYDATLGGDRREQVRLEALRRTDELVGAVVDGLDGSTLVMVVGLTPPTSSWALTPTIVAGPGVPNGTITSPATRRTGLLTLTDVAPTVLDSLGVEAPTGMIGAPLRYEPGTADLAALRGMNDLANGREGIYYPIAVTFVVVQAVAYGLVVIGLRVARERPRRIATVLRIGTLTFAAWPLATYLLRAIPGVYRLGGGAHVVLWLLALGVATVASRARRHPLAPLAWICGLTVTVLLADLALGAPLQLSSLLGYSPHTAARFTGFGNTTFAVFGACAVIATVLHVHHAPRRREALVSAASLLALVAVADGAPQLGSDVGGILTFVPVFALTIWALSGRRVSWRVVAWAALATGVALAVAVGIDLSRPPDARTHLGRFVADTADDPETFWTTVNRKWSTNLRVLQRSIWAWMVPIAAAFSLYVLVVARGWRRLLAERSPLRIGVIATIATGVVGWLVNDSGVVVAALAFVFVGPYLTLLALAPGAAPPVLRAPGSAARTGAMAVTADRAER